jgi:hypothetical protein
LYPAGHVIGWQQVPSFMQTSPVGHVRHVIAGNPQPAATGLHDGVFTSAHVSGLQQVPS